MRETSKLRNLDEHNSNVISDFLDIYFYPKIFNPNKYKFERIYNKKQQIEGLDIIITNIENNNQIGIDEKSAVHYINKKLNTFSLELSFIDKNNNIHEGWLLDNNKKNNYFLFVWIDKALKTPLSNIEDIKEIEIALIKKDIILNYLSKLGWSKSKLLTKSKKIRNNPNEYKGNINIHNCKFTSSNHLVEKPINVLLSRNKIIELSNKHIKINL